MQGATTAVAFDDHHHLGQRGHDPVAQREPPCDRLRAHWVLGQQGPPRRHLLPQPGVTTGIDDVEPRGHHTSRVLKALGTPTDPSGSWNSNKPSGVELLPNQFDEVHDPGPEDMLPPVGGGSSEH